jgi:hypothetical protein
MNRKDPERIACEYGPMARGAPSVVIAWCTPQAAFTTLPDRRQRVQTRSRLIPPFTIARTV